MPYTRLFYSGQEGLGGSVPAASAATSARVDATPCPVDAAQQQDFAVSWAIRRRGVPLAFEQCNRGRAAVITERKEQD
jgi:hypothetical protein